MTRAVGELLATQVALMRDLGSPIAACVRPGHPKAHTRRVVEGCGLAATDEVLEWFAWFDGFDCETTHDLFPAMEPIRLDAAAKRYLAMAAMTVDEPRVNPGSGDAVWTAGFPLLWHGNALLVAHLAVAPGARGAVWNFDPHVTIYTRQVAPSLRAFLELLVAETRGGSVVWDRQLGAPIARPGEDERLAALGL